MYQLTFTMIIQTPEQIQFFSDVCNTFRRVENIENKNIVLRGDSNAFLKPTFEGRGSSSIIKRSVATLIQRKEKSNLCVILHHAAGLIQNYKTTLFLIDQSLLPFFSSKPKGQEPKEEMVYVNLPNRQLQ